MFELFALVLAIGVTGYFFFGSDVMNKAGAGSTGRLSASQIAQYAANAGFEGDDLITAVAIALAESSGDPGAVGDSGTSLGLWQIHYTVHPEFDKAQLFDPQYNANAAFQLYSNRGGFNDWSTYGDLPGHNNAYLNYVDVASQAVNA